MNACKSSVGLTLAASLLMGAHALAFTAVKDNFNGEEMDARRWKPVQFDNARVRQADGSLHFTIGPKTATPETSAYVELRQNQPGYNETWMVRVNAFNGSLHGGNTGVGIWIFNADDPSDAMLFELFSSRVYPDKRVTARARITLNGTLITTKLEDSMKGRHDADMIIAYNHKTRLFTFHSGVFDEEEDMWLWTKIGTFSPTGAGGDVRADWRMNPGSGRFGVRLTLSCKGELVEDGDTYIAYFALKPTNELP